MIKLYHGTSVESSNKLIRDGWRPNEYHSGGQCGNPKYLYLTNSIESAAWYAREKCPGIVLEIQISSINDLLVDPEDGIQESVEDELKSLAGNVVIFKEISPNQIKIFNFDSKIR